MTETIRDIEYKIKYYNDILNNSKSKEDRLKFSNILIGLNIALVIVNKNKLH